MPSFARDRLDHRVCDPRREGQADSRAASAPRPRRRHRFARVIEAEANGRLPVAAYQTSLSSPLAFDAAPLGGAEPLLALRAARLRPQPGLPRRRCAAPPAPSRCFRRGDDRARVRDACSPRRARRQRPAHRRKSRSSSRSSRPPERQRAGLVEHHHVGLGDALEPVGRLDDDPAAEQPARRGDLHGGNRQRQRARAGDDEHGDGISERGLPWAPASSQPRKVASPKPMHGRR